MSNRIRDILLCICASLVMGLSAAFLWHFSNIWRYGDVLIREPVVVIRVLETVGLGLILLFGLGVFVWALKKIRGHNET